MEIGVKQIYSWCEWMMNLFLLQIYWVGGTLIGGIIFGFVPSSVALFSSIRQLHRHPKNLNLLSFFSHTYRTNFKYSLILWIWYVLACILGVVYVQFLSATTDSWLAYTHIPIYVILLFVLLTFLYLLPVYVHYKIPRKQLLPTTFTIMLTNMKWNIPLLLSLLATGLLFIQFSIVFLLFGISLPAFIIFYFVKRAFSDFDLKRASV